MARLYPSERGGSRRRPTARARSPLIATPRPLGSTDAERSGAAEEPAPGVRAAVGKAIRDRRLAFLLVGGVNTVLGTAFFVVYHALWGARLHGQGYLAALVAAHLTAVPIAFFLHRRFVFRVRGHVWRDLWRFEVVNLGAFAANLVALPLAVEALGLPPVPAQVLITAVAVVLTYLGHSHFSFRRTGRRAR